MIQKKKELFTNKFPHYEKLIYLSKMILGLV